MNTKDAQGEYLFSGAKGDTQPFVADGQDGFSYAGDTEVRFIQTGPSALIQSTDAGRDIFQVVPGDPSLKPLNAPAGLTVSVNEVGLLGDYLDDKGRTDLTLKLTSSGGYTLVDSADLPVNDSNNNPISGTAVAGATVDLTDPLGISFTMPSPLLDAPNTSVVPPVSAVTLRPEVPQRSILTTAQDLIEALKTPITDQASREESGAKLARVMDEIGISQDSLRQAVTQLGGRLVTLENQSSVNQDYDIFTQTALLNLEDLDYASAIAKFSFQEVALQAAQQTFARVNNLSLFNYL